MSQYDDADNASSTLIIGGCWVPFEPCSSVFSMGREFRRQEAVFLKCLSCESYLDPYDCSMDNYGDVSCSYCAGVEHIVLS